MATDPLTIADRNQEHCASQCSMEKDELGQSCRESGKCALQNLPQTAAVLPLRPLEQMGRLCKTCLHGRRPANAFGDWDAAKCKHPLLPINLVTGERQFPCVIARGYEQLCGPAGRYWVQRGS